MMDNKYSTHCFMELAISNPPIQEWKQKMAESFKFIPEGFNFYHLPFLMQAPESTPIFSVVDESKEPDDMIEYCIPLCDHGSLLVKGTFVYPNTYIFNCHSEVKCKLPKPLHIYWLDNKSWVLIELIKTYLIYTGMWETCDNVDSKRVQFSGIVIDNVKGKLVQGLSKRYSLSVYDAMFHYE